jgi:hypothetical protein
VILTESSSRRSRMTAIEGASTRALTAVWLMQIFERLAAVMGASDRLLCRQTASSVTPTWEKVQRRSLTMFGVSVGLVRGVLNYASQYRDRNASNSRP